MALATGQDQDGLLGVHALQHGVAGGAVACLQGEYTGRSSWRSCGMVRSRALWHLQALGRCVFSGVGAVLRAVPKLQQPAQGGSSVAVAQDFTRLHGLQGTGGGGGTGSRGACKGG